MRKFTALIMTLAMAAGLLHTVPVSAASDAVQQRLAQMTLEEKITQMLMMEFQLWDEDPADDIPAQPVTRINSQIRKLLEDYSFGAVIYFAQNLTDTQQSYHLTMDLQEAVTQNGGIPMLIAADQEGGNVFRLASGTALPGNMALGASGNPDYARLAGRIIGSELSVLGINTNLAPVVDVNSNAANPVIGLRSFGDDPATVGNMASAMIAGMAQFDVIGCAKHFPGHGDTAVDSHYGLPSVNKSLEELKVCELLPYTIAIDRGVEMIMTAHILYPQLENSRVVSRKTGHQEALPATMSRAVVTDLLKDTLGFHGIVVTDAMNMAGVADHWDPVQAVILSIQAGVDMICMPCSVHSLNDLPQLDAIIQGVAAAVENETIPMSRIDDAVTRILTVKERHGLLQWDPSNYTPEKALQNVGGSANREAERHIAAAAVTVVRNENDTLPLRLTENSRVLMLVPYENERAQMILGWNRAKEAGLIPEGAQVQTVRFDRNSTLNTFQSQLDWADTLIFNSEVTTASRMNGGRWESAYILSALAYAKSLGKTTVVQSVDKPYDVQSYPDADAVLAVYGCKGSSLDPTEALVGGITGSREAFGPNITAGIEVIFGVFGAEGKLPVDIPKLVNGTFSQEILYPRGYGLHYKSLLPEPEIPEPETIAATTPDAEETQPTFTAPEMPLTEPDKPSRNIPWSIILLLAASLFLLRRRKR